MGASIPVVELVVKTIAETTVAREQEFCDLDSVVGDGDFGYSLARGFEKILEGWDAIDRTTPGDFLKAVSMTITSRIGGTSGPIWGTAFLRSALKAGKKTELTTTDLIEMLRSSVEGIKQRGNSDVGDKTLLDSLVPAIDELERCFQAGADPIEAMERATQVATTAAEATKTMIAKRGRASYTGERSIGSVDAGATAIAIIMGEITKNLQLNRENLQ